MTYLTQLEYPHEITSVKDYLSVIRGTDRKYKKFFSGNFVCYRGQTQDWELIPSVFRYADPKAPADVLPLIAENEIYREFRNKIRGSNTELDFDNPWELICFAQHFGVPTRLIDWTTNPLAALYFALENDERQDYAVVWCLNISGLDPNPMKNTAPPSTRVAYRERDYWRGMLLSDLPVNPSFFERLAVANNTANKSTRRGLVVIQPPDIDNRIKNQGSLFSVHIPNKDELVIDQGEYIAHEYKEPEKILVKLKIPISKYRRDILDELWDLGITPYLLYPDLEGLGKYLKVVNKNRLLPHTY